MNRDCPAASLRICKKTATLVRYLLSLLFCLGFVTTADAQTNEASRRFSELAGSEVPDFQKHVVPLFGKLGCNAAKCHGSFQGQGGFRLSLFGFDFKSDYEALRSDATSADGARLSIDHPDESLIVLKPTETVDHEGGDLFEEGSWQHHLLLRWIKDGAKTTEHPRSIARLEVDPAEILFSSADDQETVRAIAVWDDGGREDVTCLCRFTTNNEDVALVNSAGLVKSTGSGDTHVIVTYDNGLAAIPILRSVTQANIASIPLSSRHPIDQMVERKLSKLGIVPSELCTDAEFLRRLSIDLTGTLPAPEEIVAFLANDSPDKRTHKIDELLDRPAYAAWWANKLCDFTGCSPTAFGENANLDIGIAYATQWYDWIYVRVRQNMPYDQLVAGIVLAESRTNGQSHDDYNAELSSYVRKQGGAVFSTRETMPHYWTRDSVKESKDKALSFAHGFLGIQLQCAECHKHPFDQWTQDDFQSFTRFFDGVSSEGRIGFPQFAAAQRGETVAWPELVVNSGESKTLSLLRSGDVQIGTNTDPRQPLMDWMRGRHNPWFARAFVNRVWAGYFHVGIVDPPDQLTPSNPPSNPELLNWLARGFVESGYDMKWLHRQIVASDTYQRSWKPNETNQADTRNFSRAIPHRIPAEVLYDGLKQATVTTGQMQAVRNDLTRRATAHLSMRMAGTHAMQVFGKPDRAINCDCERVNQPTLLQAIFQQNDPLIRQRLAESSWLQEIDAITSADQPIDKSAMLQQVWLRTVGRPASPDELERAQRHLADSESIVEGLRELMWAMLNTKEFLLNH
jgi:hypothetical protein